MEHSNPLYDTVKKIAQYCEILEDKNYDSYKLGAPVPAEEIAAWESANQVTLPDGHKQFLMLANGFDMNTHADFLPLAHICPCPDPEYADYFIVGHYIGDGSMLVIDHSGGFYELDHAYGLEKTTFEQFLERWIIDGLEDNLAEVGVRV